MPVTWLKHKYKVNKTTGRYRSSHNDGRRYKRSKSGATETNTTVLIVGPTGKRKFVKF